MKTISSLQEGDYIAFEYNHGLGGGNEIMVTNITSVDEDEVLVHFLYGHHGCAEFVKKEDIIAIGDHDGKDKIKGWSGSYTILKPEHELLCES